MKHKNKKNNNKCKYFTREDHKDSICPQVLKNVKPNFKGCKRCGYAYIDK